MNRKLLNGLLVLAVAAGGVGTFTSCKDDDFRNDFQLETASLEAQIQALRNVTDAQFVAGLEKWLDARTKMVSQGNDPVFNTYKDLVDAAATMKYLYDQIMNANPEDGLGDMGTQFAKNLYDYYIKDQIYTDFIKDIEEDIVDLTKKLNSLGADYNALSDNYKKYQEYVSSVVSQLLERASSVSVSQTYNPVLGTVNLPLGISSKVLATYVYDSKFTGFKFPEGVSVENQVFDYDVADLEAFNVVKSIANGATITNNSFTDEVKDDYGKMGAAFVTINPASINVAAGGYQVSLVNSLGEEILSNNELTLSPCNDELNFGFTRDGLQGLYTLAADAPADYGKLKFKLEDKSGLKDAIKDAVKNHNLSDVAHLGKIVYDNIQNLGNAYAVKVSWNEDFSVAPPAYDGEEYTPLPEPNYGTRAAEVNYVLSDFDVAASVIHPLGYNTIPYDFSVTDKFEFKHLGTLEYYLNKVKNNIKIDFGHVDAVTPLEGITLNIKLNDDGTFSYYYTTPSGEIKEGTGTYSPATGMTLTDMQSFANALSEAYGFELTSSINDYIITKINDAIDQINNALGKYSAQIDKVTNKIQDKLGFADNWIERYNKLADRLNEMLAQPAQYLQVVMGVNTGNGLMHLSGKSYDGTTIPVPADATADDVVTFYTTSYTGDMVVPSFKKYVAITEVVGDNAADLKALNAELGLNQVESGVIQKVYMNVAPLKQYKGKTLRITYMSLDYHGGVSMKNYYLYVK